MDEAPLQFLDLNNDVISHLFILVGLGSRTCRALKLVCKRIHGVWQSVVENAQRDVQHATSILVHGKKEAYKTALQELEHWADKGIPSACFELGNLLLSPYAGLHRNAKRGTELLTTALRGGNKLAQVRCYEGGIGVDVNHMRAWKVLQTLDQSDPRVMCLTAWFYLLGLVVDPDRDRALQLYRNAAAAGYPRGMQNLGSLLYETQPAEAFHWFQLGAEHEDLASIHAVGFCKQRGIGSPVDHAGALEAFRLAGQRGFGPSLSQLGLAYERGIGVPISDEQAQKWFKLALEAGDLYAKKLDEQRQLG